MRRDWYAYDSKVYFICLCFSNCNLLAQYMCDGDMSVWGRQVLLDSPYMLLLARGSFMINVECKWFAYFVWLWKDFAFFCQCYTQVFPIYQCYTT